jgi:hypothetical protein
VRLGARQEQAEYVDEAAEATVAAVGFQIHQRQHPLEDGQMLGGIKLRRSAGRTNADVGPFGPLRSLGTARIFPGTVFRRQPGKLARTEAVHHDLEQPQLGRDAPQVALPGRAAAAFRQAQGRRADGLRRRCQDVVAEWRWVGFSHTAASQHLMQQQSEIVQIRSRRGQPRRAARLRKRRAMRADHDPGGSQRAMRAAVAMKHGCFRGDLPGVGHSHR